MSETNLTKQRSRMSRYCQDTLSPTIFSARRKLQSMLTPPVLTGE